MRSQGPFHQVFYPLRKRWYIVLICMLAANIIATRYLFTTTPQYQASATLKIEDSQEGMANSNLYRDFDVFKANAKVNTEVEVLKSRHVFEKALQSLDFFVEYYHEGELKTEEVYGNTPFLVDYTVTDSLFSQQRFNFSAKENNQFHLSYSYNGIHYEKDGRYDEKVSSPGISLTVRKNEKVARYQAVQYLHEPWHFIVYSSQALTAKLQNKDYLVKAVDKDVNIIKIYYTCAVPEKAAKLVNAIAQTYIDQSIHEKQDVAGNTVDFISQQIAIVGQELEAARDAIRDYRIKNNIVNIPQATEATYKTLGDLEIQKVDMNMQLATLENLSDYLRREREIPPSPDYSTVVDPLFNDNLSKLNSNYQTRNELLRKYTSEDNRVKNTDAAIALLKAGLVESVNNTRRKLLARQDELYLAIDDQKSSFKGVPEKESTLQELNRNYFLYEKVYNFLIEKRTEAIITKQVNVSFNKILETAETPETAISPRKDVVWGVALFLGLIAGLILTYLRHYLKPSVHSPADFNDDTTIPVIGQVEQFRKNQTAYKTFTELSTRILMNRNPDDHMVITVTSTRRGEGKTFVATHLARTLAAMDKKVLLVDLNTHAPRLGDLFDVRDLAGIREVYNMQASLQDVIRLTSIPNLDVIAAGTNEQGPVAHLLASTRTRELITELRRHYDAVIIDTPEVGEHIDAIPFMKWSDLNLYVVRADSGRDELIANAEAVKEEYRLKEVHFVLNAMKAKRNHTGYLRPERHKQSTVNRKPRLLNLFMW